LTSEEPTHMCQRRLVQPGFHRQRIAAYGEIMLQFSGEMTERWRNGDPFDIHHSMLELTLRITGKCLFDSDVESEVKTISDSVTAFMGFLPLAFLPYPHLLLKIPFGFLGRIQKSQKKLDSLIYAMIADRRKSERDHGDLLSMLLASQNEEGSTAGMTNQQIRDECLTLLLAGHETTANGLSFIFFLMAQHPDVQEQVFAEASTVLKNTTSGSHRDATEIYERLPYAQRVVSEALRIYPPVWVTANCHSPRPTLVPATPAFQPGSFSGRSQRSASALCVLPFWSRPAHLHWRKLCVDGGSSGACQRRSQLAP
jgi:cytochrome P450